MPSFKAVLQVAGKQYDIYHSEYSLRQLIDELGRPASPTLGGGFVLDIEEPPETDSLIYDWMFSPTMQLNGQVVLWDMDKKMLKVVKFHHAFLVNLRSLFDGSGQGAGSPSKRTQLTISPQASDNNGQFHDNNWPAPDPIVDWNWSEMNEQCNPDAKKDKEPSALSEALHTALDVVGMIPVVGEIADGANALLYAGEGDYANAALSAAAMIPLAGNVVGAAKIAKRGMKLVQKAKKIVPPRLIKKLDDGVALAKKVLKKDPIDVATGMMLTQQVDISLPGPIPFAWERTWYSASDYQGPLGYGWHHQYDMGLTRDAETNIVVLRNGEGQHIAFELSAQIGQPVLDRTSGLTLYPPAADDPAGMPWRVWDRAQRVWYIFTAPTTKGVYQSLYAVANTLGQRIEFGYDEGGRLEQITDSAGRLLTLSYNAQQLIDEIHGPDPDKADEQIRLATYQYDEAGNLVSYTDAEGNHWQHQYEQHLLTQTTLPTNLSFYWQYEGAGTAARCVHTWGDGDIYQGRFAYVDENTTLMTDSDGTTRYMHQGGLVRSQVDVLGGVWQYDYNEFDALAAETDPLGTVTRYEYDEEGNTVQTRYADGTRVQISYGETGQVDAYTDARGNTWHYVYNEQGLLDRQTDPLGAVTAYIYDELGRVITVVNALEQSTQLRYDERHQLVHVVTPDEQIRSRAYDALGRIIQLTDPTGAAQQRRYDRLGQLTEVIEADGTRRSLTYDGMGNVIESQDAGETVLSTYSGTGQLASRQQAGSTVYFDYDREGRLTGLTNEVGELYRFSLDALGQVVEEEGFDGLLRQYERNAIGQITAIQQPGGRQTNYQYDAAGRVQTITYADGQTEQYGYDAEGDMIEATNATLTVRMHRDAMGRIIQEEQGQYSVYYIYNALGQRTKVSSSLGADLSLEYDPLGNVARMESNQWTAAFEYDARGLETQRQLGGGVGNSWQYDVMGRPVQQTIRQRGRISSRRSYQWQANDSLAQLTDSRQGKSTYSYDSQGSVVGAQYSTGLPEVRIADLVGNLFERADQSDRHYRAGGQLLSAGANQYRYDAMGNLIEKATPQGAWQYRWSGSDTLQEVTRPDGATVQFSYDALGRRVSKLYRGKVTRWVWDGEKPLHEWAELVSDGKNTDDLITWLFDEDSFSPIAKLQGQQRFGILTDHLGTPLEMVDQGGQTQWLGQTTIYGRVRLEQGTRAECPFRFQGQYEDVETGLYYNRFRYYAPEEGIYISQDPIGLAGGSNLYSYVWDTNQYVDVLGLSAGSRALDRALGGIVGDGKMAHHLIPELTWNANAAFLDKIGIPRSMRDAISNGLLITSTRPTPIPGKRTQIYHSTRHRQYTNKVVDKLGRIEDRLDKNLITHAQAKQQVESLQRSLRKKIQKATISTKMPCGRLS